MSRKHHDIVRVGNKVFANGSMVREYKKPPLTLEDILGNDWKDKIKVEPIVIGRGKEIE